MWFQITLSLLLKCPDQVQQCFVELLRHIIPHWLIRRPARFGCTCQLAELLNYLRIEGCTLVTMEFLRKPIVHEEMFKQNSGSSSCRLIARRYCLRILSEVVYDHLYIFVAKLGRFYLQIIHITQVPSVHWTAILVSGLFLRKHRTHFCIQSLSIPGQQNLDFAREAVLALLQSRFAWRISWDKDRSNVEWDLLCNNSSFNN